LDACVQWCDPGRRNRFKFVIETPDTMKKFTLIAEYRRHQRGFEIAKSVEV
jgi:hypothetical protein